MRLLIVTQAVDLDDPVLGFFHSWIAELAKRCERVEVICLKEGRHALPENVRVHSLGKEMYKGRTFVKRIRYAGRFFRLIWRLRREYDTVFVHMNEEYVLLGGAFWRIGGKRVVLWRNHKMGGAMTRIAAHLSHVVCYTSPSAYVARFGNAIKMPIGIDTELFKPTNVAPKPGSILFLGRLDAVKKPEMFLEAMSMLASQGVVAHADIYGDPTPGREAYADELKKRFGDFKNISFHPGVRNDEAPAIYRSHALYVNLTPSGSFDKTIGEAMATGCIIICANDAVREVVPGELMAGDSAESAVAAIKAALALSEPAWRTLTQIQRAWIEQRHSLALLMNRLLQLYE